MRIVHNILIFTSLLSLVLFSGCMKDDIGTLNKPNVNTDVPEGHMAISDFVIEVPNAGYDILGENGSLSRAYIDSDFVCANLYIAGRDEEANYVVPVVIAYSKLVDGDESSIVKYEFAAMDTNGLSSIKQQSYMLRYLDIWDSETEPSYEVTIDESNMSHIFSSEMIRLGLIYDYNETSETFELVSTTTEQEDGSYIIGTGYPSDPYVIRTEDEFFSQIREKVDDGNTLSSVCFEQGAQIVATSPWVCAGYTSKTPFRGKYCGGNIGGDISNSIIGLRIINSEADGVLGGDAAMFYKIDSWTAISDVVIIDGMAYGDSAALFALKSYGTHFSRNKVLSANIMGLHDLGGFVVAGNPSFYDCHNYASINMVYLAGVKLENYGGYVAKLTDLGGSEGCDESIFANCTFRGVVRADDVPFDHGGTDNNVVDKEEFSNSSYAGGFVGKVVTESYSNRFSLRLYNCYSSGIVSSYQYAGGIVGKSIGGISLYIQDSYVGESVDYDGNILVAPSVTVASEHAGGFFGAIGDQNTDEQESDIFIYGAALKADTDDEGAAVYTYSGKYGSGNYCGGFAGDIYDANITNCDFNNYANLSIIDWDDPLDSHDEPGSCMGGFAGMTKDCIFEDCELKNYGSMTGAYYYVGGVLGACDTSSEGDYGSKINFSNCNLRNFGSLIAGECSIGGCVGYLKNVGHITAGCTMRSYGDVDASGSSGGGVIGKLSNYGVINETFQISIFDDQELGYNGKISVGVHYAGGLIGYLYNDENCSCTLEFKGSYITVEGWEYTGGVIGEIQTDDMSDLSITLTDDLFVSVYGVRNVGGLIGRVYNGEGATIYIETRDRLKGGDTDDGSGTVRIDGQSEYSCSYGGGLMGSIYGYSGVTINHCYNRLNVFSDSGYDSEMGGLIGCAESTFTMTHSCNIATITGSASMIGGLVGSVRGCSQITDNDIAYITDCYNMGEVKGINQRGGIVGFTSATKFKRLEIESCYNTADIPEDGGEKIGGIIGEIFRVDGKRVRTKMHNLYNIGSTVHGTLGGGNPDNAEIERSNCYYYYEEGVGGCKKDADDGHNADPYSKEQMLGEMNLDGEHWGDSDDYGLPYLWGFDPYLGGHPTF